MAVDGAMRQEMRAGCAGGRAGPDDFIIEGENGWLVPPGDAAALAQCIQRCLKPETWRSLRLAPEHLRKFSVPETLAVRWAEIYASL